MTSTPVYSVVMAGGIGSRFWPMSTEDMPKQFHDVLGTGKSLLQSTIDRLLDVSPIERIIIVTNERYKHLVIHQLPDIPHENVLCEPDRKNTAPCIAFAARFILKKDKNAKMVVAPADHIILDTKGFHACLQKALNRSDDHTLFTLGIKPSRPDTGYGYIEFDSSETNDKVVRVVTKFTEKPNVELAKSFLAKGNYLWNSGIFIWSLDAILSNFKASLPDLHHAFFNDLDTDISSIYKDCESVSIDYGIMEKATHVGVVLSDFGWSDLGTWGSLYTHLPADNHLNTVQGDSVMLYECKTSIIRQSNAQKSSIIRGLENYIVVDTKNALLICPKDEEQSIKSMVAQLP